MPRYITAVAALLFANAAPAQIVLFHGENNFLDSSGNNFTATVNGSIGFRTGGPGFGQGFDVDNVVGVPAAANFLTVPGVSLANATNLSGTGLTVAAFFSEDNFANNGSLVNLRKPGNNSGFLLEPAFGAPGSMFFGVFTSVGLQSITVPGFTVGGVHHFAGVFDPANQLLSVYRNGAFVMSAPTAGTQLMRIDSDETLIIGRNAVTTTGFDGMIDELQIYNSPLSASQVAQLVIPEPASLTLVLLPAGLLVLRRRATK